MTQVNFEVLGERQVSQMLSRTTDKAKDLGPFWVMVGGLLTEIVQEQFNTEGSRTGGWAPLSDRYASDKVRQFGNQPILVATGEMRESLLGGSGGIQRQQGNDQMVFGTSVPYAVYHQAGTQRMPQRRILDMTEADRRTMMKLLQRHLFAS